MELLGHMAETYMQVRKQQLKPDMEKQTGSKWEKEYVKDVYCHPAYLTYIEYIMRNAGLEEVQAGIKIFRRNLNNLRYKWRGTKKPLDESERGEWKSCLKAQHSEY